MKLSTRLGTAFALTAAALLAAGCVGNPRATSSVMPSTASIRRSDASDRIASAAGALQPAAFRKYVYTADPPTTQTASGISVYPAGVIGASPIGAVTAGLTWPRNISVDTQGTLYVIDGFVSGAASWQILEFPRNRAKPSKRLYIDKTLWGIPNHIAVDSNGTVYVDVIDASGENDSGAVLAFDGGAIHPTRILRLNPEPTPWLGYSGGIAVDSSNTLYVTWVYARSCGSNYGTCIYKFPPGATSAKSAQMLTFIPPGAYGVLAIDSATNTLVIATTVKGSTGWDAATLYLAQLPNGPLVTHGVLHLLHNTDYQLAVDSKRHWVYADSAQTLVIYSLPALNPLGTVSVPSGSFGVAVDP